MDEIGEIMEYVQEAAGSTDIILGACDDPSIGEKLSVTIIATGFESTKKPTYTEQKVVKVYELNDDKPVEQVTTPVVEQKEETVVKYELPETVVERTIASCNNAAIRRRRQVYIVCAYQRRTSIG